MNGVEFLINNNKFLMYKDRNNITIHFYTKRNTTWLHAERITIRTNGQLTINIEYPFIDLLLNSEMFEYEQVYDRYYILKLNNLIKLQLL